MDDLGEIATVPPRKSSQVIGGVARLDLDLSDKCGAANGSSDEAASLVNRDRHETLAFS